MKQRVLCVAILAISFLGLTAVGANAAKPVSGVTSQSTFLQFPDATTTFAFNVEKAQGAGQLTVDTKDCCIAGDLWRVDIHTAQPASASSDVTGIGSGSTSEFSGAATAHFVRGCVEVSYSSGIDNFPAGMTVRFQYVDGNGTGIHITPVAGGVCT